MSERRRSPVGPKVGSGVLRTVGWRIDDPVVVAVAVLAIGVPTATGGPGLVLRVLLVLAVTAACGTAVWVGLGPGQRRIDAVTALGLGTAIGAALIGFLAIPLRASAPVIVLAVAAAISTLALIVGRAARPAGGRSLAGGPAHPRPALPFAVGIALGVVPIALSSVTFPITSTVLRPFHDAVFLQALTDGLMVRGLREMPNAAGVEVQYHWLAYAWLGSLDRITEAPTLLLLTRVAPVVALVATCALAIDLVRRLPGAVGHGPLIGSLLLFGGAWVGGAVGTGGMSGAASLSTFMGVAWMLALTLLAIQSIADPGPAGSWLLLPALAGAVCLGKIQMAIVGAGGLALMAAVGTLRAAPWAGRARRVVVVVAVGMLAVFLPFQASSARGLTFRPLHAAELLQLLPPGASGGWRTLGGSAFLLLVSSRLTGLPLIRRDAGPSGPFALGAAATGVLFVVLLGDDHGAELVAMTATAALVTPLTATALARAAVDISAGRDRVDVRRAAATCAVLVIPLAGALMLRRSSDLGLTALAPIVGVAGAAAAATVMARSGRRAITVAVAIAGLSLMIGAVHITYMAGLTATGGSPRGSDVLEISAAEVAAGAHVRGRAGATDLLVHVGECRPSSPVPSDCIGLDATPVLVTGLPAIVSTFADTFLSADELEGRLEYSLSLAAGAPLPTPDEFTGRTLWLWLEPSAAPAAAAGTGGTVTFESDEVAIVRVPGAGG